MGPDNPVRFIDAFVDSLAGDGLFQRVRPNDKGRPGYDPDLLKLYIYGYLSPASRRLEVETQQPGGDQASCPDFKTIATFRQVFREFVRLCRELDLYGREWRGRRIKR